MKHIRILMVDDHPVVRAGIRGLLSVAEDFEIVAEASDGVEAVALAEQYQPDVVLMDLRMPGTDGVTATRELVSRVPSTHVLILTTYDGDADIMGAIGAGAVGYLLKDAPLESLHRAVRLAAAGAAALDPGVAARLLQGVRDPANLLSERETEVLRLVSYGETNKGIAAQLGISVATVKTHLSHIFTKLDVPDRAAAVRAAFERGILRAD